jgi:RNA polymerase-binding transcription factor DksA
VNKKEITDLKAVICLRISFLRTLIQENEASSRDKLNTYGCNSASHTYPDECEYKAIRQAKDDLAELAITLSWLDSEAAGLCEDCSCEIPFDRIRMVPTSRVCHICFTHTLERNS